MARKMEVKVVVNDKRLERMIEEYKKKGYNVVSSHSLGHGIEVVWLKKVFQVTVRVRDKEGFLRYEKREKERYVVLHRLANGVVNVYKPKLL